MGYSFKKERSFRLMEIILLCLGIVCILKASYLPTKAFIGQKMLLSAWERAL